VTETDAPVDNIMVFVDNMVGDTVIKVGEEKDERLIVLLNEDVASAPDHEEPKLDTPVVRADELVDVVDSVVGNVVFSASVTTRVVGVTAVTTTVAVIGVTVTCTVSTVSGPSTIIVDTRVFVPSGTAFV
jgi:hypothetical protein